MSTVAFLTTQALSDLSGWCPRVPVKQKLQVTRKDTSNERIERCCRSSKDCRNIRG